MITSTGISLRSLGTLDLFDATYALMAEATRITEDEAKAVEKLDSFISDAQYEAESGMPAITQWMKPANEMVPPGTIGPDHG